nr:PAS domain-containing sensor histidine kinase [uncultured Caldimonas sp.]
MPQCRRPCASPPAPSRSSGRRGWVAWAGAALLAWCTQAPAATEPAGPANAQATRFTELRHQLHLETDAQLLLAVVAAGGIASAAMLGAIGALAYGRHEARVKARLSADTLAIEQSRHASIIDAALEAIISVDESQHIVLFNPAAERMFGCPASTAIGSDLSRFVPERLRPAHRMHIHAFGQSHEAMRPMKTGDAVMALRADGHEFPIEASISQFTEPGPEGARRIFTVMLRDITARREAEAALREMKERYRTTIDLCPNAICITEAGRISLTNKALCDLLGAGSNAELLGRRFDELFACEPRQEPLGGDGSAPATHEVQILRLDGQERDVEMLQAALPDHGSTTVQIVLRDITERKHTARLLEQSREQLKRLSRNLIRARERERQHIARELHDELGQYLTAIKMEVAAIAGPTSGRRDADRRAAALLQLIDQTVASVRRIAADLRPPMLDDLGLEAAIEWLAKDWGRRAGIDVVFDVQPLCEEIDDNAKTTVYRFVQEALTNVSRHARANRVYIRLRAHGTEVLVNVSDDGQGFPADVLAKPGTYGLLGMRERASLAGGTLWLGRADEGGASVEIRLPLDAPSTDSPATTSEA